MNKTYMTGGFRLESKGELYYNNDLFKNNCDDIIQLCLDLNMDDFGGLEKLDIRNDEEIEWLIKLLNKHVLNGNVCIKK